LEFSLFNNFLIAYDFLLILKFKHKNNYVCIGNHHFHHMKFHCKFGLFDQFVNQIFGSKKKKFSVYVPKTKWVVAKSINILLDCLVISLRNDCFMKNCRNVRRRNAMTLLKQLTGYLSVCELHVWHISDVLVQINWNGVQMV
jgi:hypothetical protein